MVIVHWLVRQARRISWLTERKQAGLLYGTNSLLRSGDVAGRGDDGQWH